MREVWIFLRAYERVGLCVCVRERERERGREKKGSFSYRSRFINEFFFFYLE